MGKKKKSTQRSSTFLEIAQLKSSQPILKIGNKKIIQETSLVWKEALPIAFLQTHIAPKEQVGFSPYEMLNQRPFVYVNDLFLDPLTQTLRNYTMVIG